MGQYFIPVCLTLHQYIDTFAYRKIANHGSYTDELPSFVMKLITTGQLWANKQIVWAGDYSKPKGQFLPLPQISDDKITENVAPTENLHCFMRQYYSKSKSDNNKRYPIVGHGVNTVEYDSDLKDVEIGSYLVNHNKKEYVDLTWYLQKIKQDPNIYLYHPLILLTITTPWSGGGGVHSNCETNFGTWAGDCIEAMHEKPSKSYKRIVVCSSHVEDEIDMDMDSTTMNEMVDSIFDESSINESQDDFQSEKDINKEKEQMSDLRNKGTKTISFLEYLQMERDYGSRDNFIERQRGRPRKQKTQPTKTTEQQQPGTTTQIKNFTTSKPSDYHNYYYNNMWQPPRPLSSWHTLPSSSSGVFLFKQYKNQKQKETICTRSELIIVNFGFWFFALDVISHLNQLQPFLPQKNSSHPFLFNCTKPNLFFCCKIVIMSLLSLIQPQNVLYCEQCDRIVLKDELALPHKDHVILLLDDEKSLYTCSLCNGRIPRVEDAKLRFCKCGATGIDATKEYTRMLGILPVEQQDDAYKNKIVSISMDK